MKNHLPWIGLLCAGCSTPTTPPVQMQPPPLSVAQVAPLRLEQPDGPQPRTVVVISDLHFGLGSKNAGDAGAAGWDAYEDFRWSREWAEFLSRIDADGQQAGTATGRVTVFEEAHPTKGNPSRIIGVYHDVYARRDGTWLFASRRLERLG